MKRDKGIADGHRGGVAPLLLSAQNMAKSFGGVPALIDGLILLNVR